MRLRIARRRRQEIDTTFRVGAIFRAASSKQKFRCESEIRLIRTHQTQRPQQTGRHALPMPSESSAASKSSTSNGDYTVNGAASVIEPRRKRLCGVKDNRYVYAPRWPSPTRHGERR